MTVLTRFAPSPTGLIHVGNTRTALVNYLYTKSKGGKFMLRIDDTDLIRSKPEYEEALKVDLKWLGIEWDIFARQSDRLNRYEEIKQKLLQDGRLYECYESPTELEIKRKIMLNRGLPPIYDRTALSLPENQKQQYIAEGRKPHYRFKLLHQPIKWVDGIRGNIQFEGQNLSDPILIREDGSMTYILSSVVDDIDFAITDIIRGEDHISNTAIQIQIFEALGATSPAFAHLALIKGQDAAISKRLGGFDIQSLRESGIHPMAINSLFTKIGTSMLIEPKTSLEELVEEFNLSKFGKAAATYNSEDLDRLNHKLIAILPFNQAQNELKHIGLSEVDENFWLSVRPNLNTIPEIQEWWKICRAPLSPIIDDQNFLNQAAQLLPQGELDQDSWDKWIKLLKEQTGRSGKQLFMPIRKALTAMEHGPELQTLLPLLGRDKVIKRLAGETA